MANYGKGGGLVMHINLQIDGLLSRYHISLDVFKPPCGWPKVFTFLMKRAPANPVYLVWSPNKCNRRVCISENEENLFLATFLGIVPMPSRYIRFNQFFK